MNEAATTPLPRSDRPSWTAITLAAGVAVCLIAISSQSFWIDEAGTAWKTVQPSLRDWWLALRSENNSNLQLPLYLLFAWGWVKFAGVGEFALRAGNAPWYLAGLMTVWWGMRPPPSAARNTSVSPYPLRAGVVTALLCSPFAWYYLNEARPYAMQVGASLMVFAALYRLSLDANQLDGAGRWVATLSVSSVILAASGMLAMLWLGAFLTAAMLSTPVQRLRLLARRYVAWWGVTLLLLLGIGIYYLWTLTLGARAAAIHTDLRSLAFIMYELLGFAGLGPSRTALRVGGADLLKPWLPVIGTYASVVLIIAIAGLRQINASFSRRVRMAWLVSFLFVAAFILAVGLVVHFRVLGRHFSPVFPLIVLVLGFGIARILHSRRIPGIIMAATFIGLAATSCLFLRFSKQHSRDDYRSAAAIARDALKQKQTLWWNADDQGALIYHVAITNRTPSNAALFLIQPGPGFEKNLSQPDMVITSKPDLYDKHGALSEYLARSGYRRTAVLNAFTVWQAPYASHQVKGR